MPAYAIKNTIARPACPHRDALAPWTGYCASSTTAFAPRVTCRRAPCGRASRNPPAQRLDLNNTVFAQRRSESDCDASDASPDTAVSRPHSRAKRPLTALSPRIRSRRPRFPPVRSSGINVLCRLRVPRGDPPRRVEHQVRPRARRAGWVVRVDELVPQGRVARGQ